MKKQRKVPKIMMKNLSAVELEQEDLFLGKDFGSKKGKKVEPTIE